MFSLNSDEASLLARQHLLHHPKTGIYLPTSIFTSLVILITSTIHYICLLQKQRQSCLLQQ